MPLSHYGVLAATAVERVREGAVDTPHYQIHLRDEHGTHYRAAVNVKSQQAPSDLLYLVDDRFRHPLTNLLPTTPAGWTPLPPGPGGPNLDFIRGNLFDPSRMRQLPPDVTGPDNDLADQPDHCVRRALGDASAVVHVFGQRWGPEAGTKDRAFGFNDLQGVLAIEVHRHASSRRFNSSASWHSTKSIPSRMSRFRARRCSSSADFDVVS